MEILFLGTCACDFSPRLQTDCRDRFDKDARRSSCVLVNGHVLVDCGPHTLDSLRIANIPAVKVTDLLVTHLHSDHFDVANVAALAAARRGDLRVWVREDAVLPPLGCDVRRMRIGEEYEVGGLRVTPLEANHTEFPQHFVLREGGRSVFYGTDGAWVLYDTFRRMWEQKFDVMILDCTVGDRVGDFRIGEHNSIPMIRQMLPSFAATGVTDGHSKVYLTHLAPSLHEPHERTQAICAEFGALVAYDGLRLEV